MATPTPHVPLPVSRSSGCALASRGARRGGGTVEKGPGETLRAAVELLRRGGAVVDDDWIILMLLDRVEAAQSQTDIMLRAAGDLAQANIALHRERDQIRTALRGA